MQIDVIGFKALIPTVISELNPAALCLDNQKDFTAAITLLPIRVPSLFIP